MSRRACTCTSTVLCARCAALLSRHAQAVSPRVDRLAAPLTPNAEPEARFQARVIALAKAQGWHCHWTHDSRRSPEGWPDLVLCNGQETLFCELKSATGKVSMPQQRWLSLLARAGQEVHVWKNTDWPAIEARLAPQTSRAQEENADG